MYYTHIQTLHPKASHPSAPPTAANGLGHKVVNALEAHHHRLKRQAVGVNAIVHYHCNRVRSVYGICRTRIDNFRGVTACGTLGSVHGGTRPAQRDGEAAAGSGAGKTEWCVIIAVVRGLVHGQEKGRSNRQGLKQGYTRGILSFRTSSVQ